MIGARRSRRAGPRGTGVPDPGLQPERTSLAWRRTAVAVGAGSLLAARAVWSSSTAGWGLLVCLVGIGVAVLTLVAGELRCASVIRRFPDPRLVPTSDGRVLLGIAAGAFVGSVAAFMVVAVTTFGRA